MSVALTMSGGVETLRSWPGVPAHCIGPLYAEAPPKDVPSLYSADMKIKRAYEVSAQDFCLDVCSSEAQEQLCQELSLNESCNVAKFNKVGAIIAASITAGTTLVVGITALGMGALAGSMDAELGGTTGVAGGAAIGGTLGVVGGLAVGVPFGGVIYWRLASAEAERRIFGSKPYTEWKKRMIKERYDLYVSFMRTVRSDLFQDACERYSSIKAFPFQPVVCPPEGAVYEKDEIKARPDGGEPDVEYAFDFAEDVVRQLEVTRTPSEEEEWNLAADSIARASMPFSRRDSFSRIGWGRFGGGRAGPSRSGPDGFGHSGFGGSYSHSGGGWCSRSGAM